MTGGSNGGSAAGTTTSPLRAAGTATTAALTVAALRRSSSHVTPTRTLHLSEQEHRGATPPAHRVTLESLQQRPRSNQRTRTPRQNESPLDPDEFRRHEQPAIEPRRITIRPGAGAAVGTIAPPRIREESPPRSAKQGPSHRKVRRWNNDHFDHLAAEIAPTSRRAATVLLQGKQNAHLYKAIYDPADHESKSLRRFLYDDKLHKLKSRFSKGELPSPMEPARHKPTISNDGLSGEDMLMRIEARLRRVVVRACHNSYPACRVVKALETFILESFVDPRTSALSDDWWHDLLLTSPIVTITDGKGEEQQKTVQFLFDSTSATGGFHRLLLHAVCQFHGLKAMSRIIPITPAIGSNKQSRALTVTGATCNSSKFRLMQVLSDNNDDDDDEESLGTKLEDSWTVV